MASSAEHARSGSRGGGGAAKTSLTLMVMLHGNNAEKVAAQQAHLVRYKGRWKSCGSTTVEFGGFHSFFNACRGCAAKGEQHTVLAQASATQRTAAMLMAMAREHPGVEWLFKLDDDGYLYVENLLAAACAQSEAMAAAPRPRYSGFLMRQVPDVWGVDYCAGGAGYLINRQALRSCEALATCGSGKEDLPYEDVGLGYCLSTCGIKAERLEGAYPDTPEKMLEWVRAPDPGHVRGYRLLRNPISYHYIPASRIPLMEFRKGRKIPKRMHQIWVGDGEKAPTDMMIHCSQLHPDWEFFLWDEKTLQGLKYDSKYQNDGAYTLRKGFMPTQKPFSEWPPNLTGDVVRTEVLYRFGGVAFDADTLCLRSLSPLLDELERGGYQYAAAYESEGFAAGLVAAGTQFAVQYSPVLYHGLKGLMSLATMKPAWIQTGPVFTSHVVVGDGALCLSPQSATLRFGIGRPNITVSDALPDELWTEELRQKLCKPRRIKLWPSHLFYPHHHRDLHPHMEGKAKCGINTTATVMMQRWSTTFNSYRNVSHLDNARQSKESVRAQHGRHFHTVVPDRLLGEWKTVCHSLQTVPHHVAGRAATAEYELPKMGGSSKVKIRLTFAAVVRIFKERPGSASCIEMPLGPLHADSVVRPPVPLATAKLQLCRSAGCRELKAEQLTPLDPTVRFRGFATRAGEAWTTRKSILGADGKTQLRDVEMLAVVDAKELPATIRIVGAGFVAPSVDMHPDSHDGAHGTSPMRANPCLEMCPLLATPSGGDRCAARCNSSKGFCCGKTYADAARGRHPACDSGSSGECPCNLQCFAGVEVDKREIKNKEWETSKCDPTAYTRPDSWDGFSHDKSGFQYD